MARALAWHARGHRFDPDILHISLAALEAEQQKRESIFDLLAHKTVVKTKVKTKAIRRVL